MLNSTFRKIGNHWIPFLSISIGLGIWVYLFITWNFNGIPVWSDEFFYWMNASSFFKTGSIDAVLTFDGHGSRWLQSDAHGPFYNLSHGLIAQIIGWNTYNFQLFNFLLIVGMFAFILMNRTTTKQQKLDYITLIFAYPFLILYSFSFLQEILHAFIALVLAILLYKISKYPDKKVFLFQFIITIVLAGLFRPLWFLWGFAIIPFIWSRYSKVYTLLVFISLPIIAVTFNFFLLESLPNKFSLITERWFVYGDFLGGLLMIWENSLENLAVFFFDHGSLRYSFMRPLFFILIIYFTFSAYKKKTKLNYSLLIIGWTNFLLLIVVYDAYFWRDIRTMSPLFYFLGFFFVLEEQKNLIKGFQILCLISLVGMVKISKDWIIERQEIALADITMIRNELLDLFSQEQIEAKAIIYIDDSYHLTFSLLTLPELSKEGKPFKYIIPYYEKKYYTPDYILTYEDQKFYLRPYSE